MLPSLNRLNRDQSGHRRSRRIALAIFRGCFRGFLRRLSALIELAFRRRGTPGGERPLGSSSRYGERLFLAEEVRADR